MCRNFFFFSWGQIFEHLVSIWWFCLGKEHSLDGELPPCGWVLRIHSPASGGTVSLLCPCSWGCEFSVCCSGCCAWVPWCTVKPREPQAQTNPLSYHWPWCYNSYKTHELWKYHKNQIRKKKGCINRKEIVTYQLLVQIGGNCKWIQGLFVWIKSWLRLERWLSGLEHWLIFQRTWAPSIAHGGSQPCPVSGDLTPSSVFHRQQVNKWRTDTCRQNIYIHK